MDGGETDDVANLLLRQGMLKARPRARLNHIQPAMQVNQKIGQTAFSRGPADRAKPVHQHDAFLLDTKEHQSRHVRRAGEQAAECRQADRAQLDGGERHQGFGRLVERHAGGAQNVAGQMHLQYLPPAIGKRHAAERPAFQQHIDRLRSVTFPPDRPVARNLLHRACEAGK